MSSYVLSWRPPMSSLAETGRILSGLSTNQTLVSDLTVVTVTSNWSRCCTGNVICVYCTSRQRRVANRPLFIASRAASNGHPWDHYRCFTSSSNGRRVGLCAYVQQLLWIPSVPVRNAVWDVPQHDRETRNVTSVGVQSLLLGLFIYLYPFRNTRLSMCWGCRRERRYLTAFQSPKQKLLTMLELRENGV